MYKTATILAFIATFIWAIKKPDYDSIAAVFVAFSAIIGVFLVRDRKQKQAKQAQEVGAGSIGIQAGRDVNVDRIVNK